MTHSGSAWSAGRAPATPRRIHVTAFPDPVQQDLRRERGDRRGRPVREAGDCDRGRLRHRHRNRVRPDLAWPERRHILGNNASIMALPDLERPREGWEMQFATTFMGHFALTVRLHDALAAARGARIVSVSSSGHLFSPVVFDDLHFDFRAYDPFAAYGQSKTAGALLAVEATRRWSGEGIYANALNPGAIATGLQQHTGGLKTPKERPKSVQQGAGTSGLLASSAAL